MTSHNPSVTLSDQYARFGLSLQLRDVPRAVQTRAKHLILDAVGIALASRGYTYADVSFAAFSELGSGASPVIGFLCADRLGRARGLVVFAIATIAVGFVYPNMHAGWAISLVGFVLITCIYTVATLGLFAYIPELFPTELRLRGTGTAGVCGRAASMTTPYFAVLLYNSFGVSGVLAMVSGVLALLVVGILLLRVETNQHALEQISPSLDTQSDPMPATQQG